MRFLASVLVLIIAVPFCPGQSARTDVHLIQRVTGTSASSEDLREFGATERLRAMASLVLVPVIVTDEKNRMVIGLERENFSVYEGNDRQFIRSVSTEDAPISLGIIFDTSSSMYGKTDRSRQAIAELLRNSASGDEFFLIGFASRPELLVDFTNSVDEIEDAISRATPEGLTALLDAVYLGLNMMKNARTERRVLLIVSDGGDNHSRYTARDLLPALAESNVQIYAMGIFDDAPRTTAERNGPELLASMTNVAGGRMLPIHHLNKIGRVVSELSIELRNQYLIAYRPSVLRRDGKWRKIRVRVTSSQNRSRLRVYAKGGYYAPAE